MKKLLLLFFIVSCFSFIFATEHVILVSNPSYVTISNIAYLVKEKKIDIPNLKIIGVYHKLDRVKYESAKAFVKSRNIKWIAFKELEGVVAPKNLFKKNKWTKTFHTLFSQSHGIFFPGGPDIPPFIYGRKTNLLTVIRFPRRHYYELSFIFHLLGGNQNKNWKAFLHEKPNYMIWSICLGMQSLNVGTGGTLHQDIPSTLYNLKYMEDVLKLPESKRHRNYKLTATLNPNLYIGVLHPIKLLKSTPIQLDATPFVLSIHHQCIDILGKDLKVWATSLDGKVVEGVRHRVFPHVFGIQFHPEKRQLWDITISKKNYPKDKETVAQRFLRDKKSVEFNNKIWKLFTRYVKNAKKK